MNEPCGNHALYAVNGDRGIGEFLNLLQEFIIGSPRDDAWLQWNPRVLESGMRQINFRCSGLTLGVQHLLDLCHWSMPDAVLLVEMQTPQQMGEDYAVRVLRPTRAKVSTTPMEAAA